ncbi:MAG: type II toxin-antitoxin system VapC family toxin [Rhodothermales bacterium]|nr:type II toxin-antitoxin system VapC family toxin [Rhodothermales bacterium]
MIVADTNLLAYLLLSGPEQATAEGVRSRDPDWRVPPLWRSELRSVLLQHLRQGLLAADEAEAIEADAVALVTEHEAAALPVLRVAVAHGLSAYDAEFVALAVDLGGPLVTNDRRVLKACPGVAVSLSDFAGADGAVKEGPG